MIVLIQPGSGAEIRVDEESVEFWTKRGYHVRPSKAESSAGEAKPRRRTGK